MNPSISRRTMTGRRPTPRYHARARPTVSALVRSPGTSSIKGSRCGGLAGWATRNRAAAWPGSSAACRLGTMAELELAMTASGCAPGTTSASSSRLTSSRSGAHSWMSAAPATASARLAVNRTRA